MAASLAMLPILAAILLTPFPAVAANWLMLQGVEPPANTGTVKLWGFIQPGFMATRGSELPAGGWAGQDAVFNQIPPQLDAQARFNINRARLGVRGANVPFDSRMNYFLLAEFGTNGITYAGAGRVKLVDASITLNHLPGARIRIGQFKTPGAEEGLQAIHIFDYINFTSVTDQLLNERFFNSDGTDTAGNSGDRNAPNGPVGAFRDIGVQVFDALRRQAWEYSYAAMLGNGNGIDRGDDNSSKDLYLYGAAEWLSGNETGPRRPGVKLFAWRQSGQRDLNVGAGQTPDSVERVRQGVGMSLRKAGHHLVAEYMVGRGVIPNGTDAGAVPGALNNAGTRVASFNVLADGRAAGWYVDLGYAVTAKWEFDLRYDVLQRGTESAIGRRDYTTTTLGLQYFFSSTARLTFNYEIRAAEAPRLPHIDPANVILRATDNRAALQLTSVF